MRLSKKSWMIVPALFTLAREYQAKVKQRQLVQVSKQTNQMS